MKGIFAFVLLSIFALTQSQVILPINRLRQVHSQDVLGQYYYGYNDGLSTKHEIRGFDGSTRGSYSYVDATGKIQTVDYIADALNGFRVAGTNLPKEKIPTPLPIEPIRKTPEVIDAEKKHFKAVEDAKLGLNKPIIRDDLPKPVEDTLEVKAAKASHFALKKEAELLASVKPEVIIPQAPIVFGRPALTGFSTFGAVRPFSPLWLTNSTAPVPISTVPVPVPITSPLLLDHRAPLFLV